MPASTHPATACRRLSAGRRRWVVSLTALWLLLDVGSTGAAAAGIVPNTAATPTPAPQELVPITMRVGFTSASFLQGNRNDVTAAFKVLVDSVGRKHGFAVTVEAHFFQNAAAYQAAVEAGEINFAVFDSLTYVAQQRRSDLTPVFLPRSGGIVGRRYLLVVSRDSGIRSLEDLRGRKLVEYQAPDLSLGHTWLLNLLLEKRAGRAERFFSEIEYVGKPAAAVLPVFFGKRDVCLVDDLGFRLMAELNPQVGARLQPLATSVPLVGAVICASESNWSSRAFRPVLLEALAGLDREPAGKQLLALFKIDQLVPYQDSQVDSVRELWLSYAAQKAEVDL